MTAPQAEAERPEEKLPCVLNKRRHKIPKEAVYVGRGSPWGNPFKIGPDGDRTEVIERFRVEVLPTLNVTPLRGKDLVCYCAPQACHADLLLQKANTPLETKTEARKP